MERFFCHLILNHKCSCYSWERIVHFNINKIILVYIQIQIRYFRDEIAAVIFCFHRYFLYDIYYILYQLLVIKRNHIPFLSDGTLSPTSSRESYLSGIFCWGGFWNGILIVLSNLCCLGSSVFFGISLSY